jgi:hypothetical protein
MKRSVFITFKNGASGTLAAVRIARRREVAQSKRKGVKHFECSDKGIDLYVQP